MFLPDLVNSICSPQYIRCERGAEFQLNVIPLTYNGGANSATLYFPRPFLILGLAENQIQDIPVAHAGVPYWPWIYSTMRNPADQSTYSDLAPALFLELALATMYPYDPAGFPRVVNYVSPGIQGTNYRGYFTKFLNDSVNAESRQWLNTFNQPGSLWKRFADLNAALTDVAWNDKFHLLIEFLERNADQRLFGSPGLYSISDDEGQSDEWLMETSYEFQIDS